MGESVRKKVLLKSIVELTWKSRRNNIWVEVMGKGVEVSVKAEEGRQLGVKVLRKIGGEDR